MRKLLFIGVIILLIWGFSTIYKKDAAVVVVEPTVIPLCFYAETPTGRGLFDVALLKMNLVGDTVTGEFRNIPAEKDSKVGTFEGTVSAVDPIVMARTANVWWDSLAEGMHVTEELKIIFGEGNAQAGFGEMIDRGDGAYIYKDVSKIVYGKTMTDVACSDLDDRLLVEKYIRENIVTLAQTKPVLGGTWYITRVSLDPTPKTGMMFYEDGHIVGSATFSYTRDGDQVTISNIKKIK